MSPVTPPTCQRLPVSSPSPTASSAPAPALTSATTLAALALATAMCLAGPSPLAAQEDTADRSANLAPLTEADVPAALDALRELANSGGGKDIMDRIARSHGTTRERLAVITLKVMAGAALAKPGGPDPREMAELGSMPNELMPSVEEMAVIRGTYDQISAILLSPLPAGVPGPAPAPGTGPESAQAPGKGPESAPGTGTGPESAQAPGTGPESAPVPDPAPGPESAQAPGARPGSPAPATPGPCPQNAQARGGG
ncbi:MAG: hypothetical protein LBT40_15675, partial [Deltaproteobacteria bacterium]|nr:hypothetical protein [Deltaproteobacteria bacterium]